jgi:hypothetical protein
MPPISIASTASTHRNNTLQLRSRRSAAMPVIVIVSTVVVASGTARERAVAFC